ncbi:bacteriohemerythrin [Azospirillum thermophilum]|uniref:Hemerythrin n=1 Tax=Azospirillum thermophilum TaxID=2202148 RepID=A0A2S2CWH0_9PROT|nr:bacteriohemerythrin [Azospirillum thermophilum]AWK88831.1 hemerythrin [Azospirillum thermophilum]
MDHVAWDETMSVGVAILDDDHKKLLDMFNGLLRTGITAGNRDDLCALLGSLRAYTTVHFAREEEWMESHGFPELPAHKAAHRYFVEEVEKLHRDFEGSNTTMLRVDLILLLKEWFIEHIQHVDAQYRPYGGGTAPH